MVAWLRAAVVRQATNIKSKGCVCDTVEQEVDAINDHKTK